MKNRITLLVFLVLGINGLAAADVQLVPVRVEESRSVTLASDNMSGMPDSLIVGFMLKGPEADSAVRYGRLKLEEAVDDLGNSLIPPKDPFNDPAKFSEFPNAQFRKMALGGNQPVPAPEIQIRLAPSKRAATKIAVLRGSVCLADAGTVKSVEASSLMDMPQRTVDIPAEAGFGITLAIIPDNQNQIHQIGVEFSGDWSGMDSIEVENATGGAVSYGLSSWSVNGGPLHYSLNVGPPLDDTMKLVVKYAVGRTMTTVPFEFKDIALP
ncbi:MAG: hypothetical protein ABSF29_13400 [Tepidisphaeraceae bacterium]